MPGTYNLKSQLRSEQAGWREETPQVHSARASLRRRYLQPQGGPPPELRCAREAFASRSALESQHPSEEIAREAI